MASSHKKVIVRKMGRDSMADTFHPRISWSEGKLELLNPSGKVVLIDLGEVKSVDFVRDFSDTAAVGRKTFTSRPRTDGLWVRLKFTDNDILEGLMANDLTQVGAEGFFITPPDTRGNTQRVFVPRTALQELNVLAVIGVRSPQENAGRRAPGKVVYRILMASLTILLCPFPLFPLQSRL